MDELCRSTFRLRAGCSRESFENSLEKQLGMYFLLYPTRHREELSALIRNGCLAAWQGEVGEYFFDVRYPSFSISFSVAVA